MKDKGFKLVTGIVIVAIAAPILLLIDGGLGSSKVVSGFVVSKQYDPAWTEVQTDSDGEHVRTTVTAHPARWSTEVYSSAMQGSFRADINESDFNSLRTNERVNASVRIGHFSGSVVWATILGPAETP